jgi:uncharacterized protein (DUF2147 family)
MLSDGGPIMHAAISAALSLALAQPVDQPSIEGRWTNPGHSVIVEIAQCETALCGTVQWATQQAQQDARKGTPTLIGTQILTELEQDGAVWKGKLFVPDQNLRAQARIESDGVQLKVSGCEFGICKSQLWTRADGPLPQRD